METARYIAVVGSRDFSNYQQLRFNLSAFVRRGDILVSGGAQGADSLVQRYAKEHGMQILIIYPDYERHGSGAPFVRNEEIALRADHVMAFYAKDRFQKGGTRNTIEWAIKLDKPYTEFKEN